MFRPQIGILILIFSPLFANHEIPQFPDYGKKYFSLDKRHAEYEPVLRLSLKKGRWNVLLEGRGFFGKGLTQVDRAQREGKGNEIKTLQETRFNGMAYGLGFYYRVWKYLKLGLFYRVESGALHDDDWVPGPSSWEWRNKKFVFEHLGDLDMTWRYQLNSLPGKNWVLELKTRYQFNFSDNLHKIKLRPGITYFLIHRSKPIMNLFMQYEHYFLLGKTELHENSTYEQWWYLGLLGHATSSFKVGASVALRDRFWRQSEKSSEDYYSQYKTVVIGLILQYHFRL